MIIRITIIMLNPDFDNIAGRQTQARSIRIPKKKVQYSAGFRQVQPNIKDANAYNNNKQSHLEKNYGEKSQVLLDVEQLGIENLGALFKQTIPDNTHLLLEKKRQQQEQATVRLYRNLYPNKKKTETDENEENEEKPNKKYAEDIWDLDLKYEQQPPDFIVKKQVEKVDKKCRTELSGIVKKKKIEQQIQFPEIFSYFLLQDSLKILESSKKETKNSEMELYFLWKGFLSTINFKTASKKYEKQKISEENLQNLRKKSKYLFSLIKPQQKQINQKYNKPPQLVNAVELKDRISVSLKFEISELKETFDIKKQYTNPFNIESLAHKSESKQQSKIPKVPEYTEEEQIFVFKAAPVPSSTYRDPKEKVKPEPKTTVQKPFKLKQKGEVTSPQQYYQFQKMRQFKAQSIPNTTYKPYKPELLSEQQKKARAVLLLKESKYPKTMQILDHYTEHKRQKVEELAQRHAKVRIPEKRSQIPNFDRLHAQQLVLFQTLKQQNKKDIKIQPFNLSVGTKKVQTQQNVQQYHPEIHPYSPPHPAKPSKSTKKFDAYINFRSEQQQKRANKQQQEQKEKQKRKASKQPYRQILKRRMADQFGSHPQKRNSYDASMPMKIKVDKQKIYKEQPLLMTSSLPKQEYCLPWDPIF